MAMKKCAYLKSLIHAALKSAASTFGVSRKEACICPQPELLGLYLRYVTLNFLAIKFRLTESR